jgi:hypothetical protein
MKLIGSFKTKRSTIAEPACGSCSELPIELVDHYFLELVDRPLWRGARRFYGVPIKPQ